MRRVCLGDLDSVFDLLKQLWPHEKLSKKKFYGQNKLMIKRKGYSQYVFLSDDLIIGYAMYHKMADIQSQKEVAYLSALIVDESYQGKGFGKKLLDYVMRAAKKDGCFEMHFPSTFKRKKAHKLYDSMGFNKSGYYFWKKI